MIDGPLAININLAGDAIVRWKRGISDIVEASA